MKTIDKMKFKNMKIAVTVTADQPLEEIVRELKKKGLQLKCKFTDNPTWVTANKHGYSFFDFNPVHFHTESTLTELKEM